jgi:hypothetical protein
MKGKDKRVPSGATVVESRTFGGGKIFPIKIIAVSDHDRVFYNGICGYLDLVSSVPFEARSLNCHRSCPIVIQEIQPIRDIVTEINIIEDPVGAGLVRTQTIAIAAL